MALAEALARGSPAVGTGDRPAMAQSQRLAQPRIEIQARLAGAQGVARQAVVAHGDRHLGQAPLTDDQFIHLMLSSPALSEDWLLQLFCRYPTRSLSGTLCSIS